MLLTDKGLEIGRFTQELAGILGKSEGDQGGHILSEARIHNRGRVELRDWFYVLAKVPGSLVRQHLVEAARSSPERFVELLEASFDTALGGVLPRRLVASAVTDDVHRMLQSAEEKAGKAEINEAALTQAILDTAGGDFEELLKAWAGEEPFKRFLNLVANHLGGAPKEIRREDLFDERRRLQLRLFAPSGRKLCERLKEDAASLGAKKITVRHLLYSLLGLESSALCQALAMRGFDIKKDLLPNCFRQIGKPGAKRNLTLDLGEQSLLGSITEVFLRAAQSAQERGGAGIGEADISRAFIRTQHGALKELMPKDALDITGLRDYLDGIEPQDEEEDQPLSRRPVKEIEALINERVRGQGQAVSKIMPWIKRLRFGLAREERPAGVFLFMGPTGTGKTQLAKELARHVYGNEEQILFMEMGQFQTKESMNIFIGAPAGYIGYGEGKLTNGLRDKPECVVLFDEIEKADVQVFDALLRFADEGRISDPAGPERDGRRCIIVMTTNAGQTWLQETKLGLGMQNTGDNTVSENASPRVATLDQSKARATIGVANAPPLEAQNSSDGLTKSPEIISQKLEEIRQDLIQFSADFLQAAKQELQQKGFRPEFIGRVDELITFLPFDLSTCRQILDDTIKREGERLEQAKGIALVVDEEARKRLAKKAMLRSLREGARAVPRVVTEEIISPLIDLATEQEEQGMLLQKVYVTPKGADEVAVEPA